MMAAATPFELDILAGADALAFVESPDQAVAWRRLWAATPWGTAFQHPAFARIWYRHYGRILEPVVVLARGADQELVGLLCLCRDPVTRQLWAAGTHQAEYQSWLCTPVAARFPREAVEALRARFPGYGIRFKYVPPGVPLDSLLTAPRLVRLIEWRRHGRPLYDANAGTGHHRTAKRRLNQLRRLGKVCFRFVEHADDFARWLDHLSPYYDVRQGTKHGGAPFQDDPVKRAVHLDWFTEGDGAAQACVLELNDEPIAGLFGLVSRDTLHNCVLAHSPLLARYSPGSVLLMLLAEALPSRRLAVLDLTPGADAWKERYASRHDEVLEIIVHSSRAAAVRARLTRMVRAVGKRLLRRADSSRRDAGSGRHANLSGWMSSG